MMLRSIVIRHFGNCIGAIRRMGAVLKVFGGVAGCGPRHNKGKPGCGCGWRPRIELDDVCARV
jgi:hypothetical protein